MNDWRPFVFGGLASVTAETGTFFLDTIKTRLQVQGQQIDVRLREQRYRGITHAFVRICREEGPTALYNGLKPALLRQASYGTIKIGIYHSMKRYYFDNPQEEQLLPNVFCGVVAGVVSSAIANPTDVLKVRMQAQTDVQLKNKGLVSAFFDIWKQEGVRGLWRGVGPTANRAAIVVGVELPAYDFTKKHMLSTGVFTDNVPTHFLASFFAGLLGAIASNPVDVIKSRMMNQRRRLVAAGSHTTGGTAIYTSATHCLVQTYRHEGFMALYRGFIPNWLRLGPWNIIFFITYEQFKKMY